MHSNKALILFGWKNEALTEILENEIVQGFLDLYERMLSSEE
jgi:hypothetical protein